MVRITFILAAWAFIVAAVLARSSYIEARLLRADPASIPGDAMLSGFGRERGAVLFEGHCAICHGDAGRGDPRRGIPDLTDDDWLYGSGSVSSIAWSTLTVWAMLAIVSRSAKRWKTSK